MSITSIAFRLVLLTCSQPQLDNVQPDASLAMISFLYFVLNIVYVPWTSARIQPVPVEASFDCSSSGQSAMALAHSAVLTRCLLRSPPSQRLAVHLQLALGRQPNLHYRRR
jgi:hypothetical protein